MKRILVCALMLGAPAVHAHHGVASLGSAALEGPGAPIESASSAVLPKGKTLLYAKLDHAKYKTFDPDPTHPESDYANYWMVGVGHGFAPWLSLYLFAPYHAKIDEPGGLDSKGWADHAILAQIGFKHEPGQGLRLVPEKESLDDLEDWHFTLYFGGTLPTGNANHRLADGSIDPGKAHGFGKPTASVGMTASKLLSPATTLHVEASTLRFRTHRYADGNTMRFGHENRLNIALTRRLQGDAEKRLRLDGVIEAQFLSLGRDIENGKAASATGGRVLYLMPGLRLYHDRMSFAAGVKKPLWTRLNEESMQQGAEGKEKYRLLFSLSYIF
ncbi:MAG: hypothetical protein N2441_09915 [Rhodocyclaceae bacterium]|nr:hypothetical protein [Rhodocyclaceae bacterium]